MTHLRTVRLPASVPVETVSTTGAHSSTQVATDGTITVRFDGLLLIDGRAVPSPGQLLQLWHGTGAMEFGILDQALGDGDVMPVDAKAKMAAYGVGLDMVRQGRAKGFTDAQVAQVLRAVREQSAAQAKQVATQHRAGLAQTDRIMARMIEDWELAISYEWSDDQ